MARWCLALAQGSERCNGLINKLICQSPADWSLQKRILWFSISNVMKWESVLLCRPRYTSQLRFTTTDVSSAGCQRAVYTSLSNGMGNCYGQDCAVRHSSKESMKHELHHATGIQEALWLRSPLWNTIPFLRPPCSGGKQGKFSSLLLAYSTKNITINCTV